MTVPSRSVPVHGKETKPVQLRDLIVWLALATMAIAVLVGAFTFILRGQLLPWNLDQPLTARDLQQVVQSAVTTAAALGLGATLYLSFRKQRTADDNYASTLELLRLQQDQHRSEGITRLRDRYVKAAEQLGSESRPIRLAGIYALASLADDWNEINDLKERQVCIDLLTSYLALGEKDTDTTEIRGPEWETIWSSIFQRTALTNTTRDWAGALVRIRNIRLVNKLEGLRFDFESLNFSNSVVATMVFDGCHFDSSQLLFDLAEPESFLVFRNCRFSGGSLNIALNGDQDHDDDVSWRVLFYNSSFEGTEVTLGGSTSEGGFTFSFCQFMKDATALVGAPDVALLQLEHCHFAVDPLRSLDRGAIDEISILDERIDEASISSLAETYNKQAPSSES